LTLKIEDDEENSFGMEDDLIQPIWRVELNTVLDEQILDVDILKVRAVLTHKNFI
jgi:hypothetical protein